MQASLVAPTKEDGSFELRNVPAGEYVVLYDRLGGTRTTWTEVQGLQIDYSDGNTIVRTLVGSGGTIEYRNFGTEFKGPPIPMIKEGGLTSSRYGLSIEFYKGDPIVARVEAGQITEVEIKAWEL